MAFNRVDGFYPEESLRRWVDNNADFRLSHPQRQDFRLTWMGAALILRQYHLLPKVDRTP